MRRKPLGLLLLLTACGDGFVARDTQLTFEPDTTNFWALPFPSDLRRPLTTYAAVVTDAVKDLAGKPLGRAQSFHNALEQQPDVDAKAAASFEPLRVWLKKVNRDRSKVVAATVFKTMDASATLV